MYRIFSLHSLIKIKILIIMAKDKEFIEYVVKSLVNNPDDVTIERKVDEMGTLLLLRVNQKDMGAIIGKEGSTIKAIRSLVRIIGLKNNARVNLKLEETGENTRPAKTAEVAEKVAEEKDDLDKLEI